MIVHIINSLASGGAEKLMLEEVQSSQTEKHAIIVLRNVSSELSGLLNSDEVVIENMSIGTLIRYSRMKKDIIIKSYLFRSHIVTFLFWMLGCRILWVYHSTIYSRKLSLVQGIVRVLSYFVPAKQVYVSEHAKNTHMRKGFSGRNISIVHNGIKLFDMDRNIGGSRNRVGFIGRDTKVKNIDLLFKTIQSCICLKNNLIFYLYGEDFRESNEKIVGLLKYHGIYECTKLMGYSQNIFDADVKLGLLVSTSIDESFGLALVEAASRGIPIASVNLLVMEELFPNLGVNSYSTNPEQNAEHWIQTLNKNLSYKLKLQKSAMNYNVKSMYQNYQSIYGEMMKR